MNSMMNNNIRVADVAGVSRRLIIRIASGSLAFSTTDENNKIVYESYPLKSSISMAANLREALRTTPMLSTSYQRVLVMVDCPVLMVPTDCFHKSEQEQLYYHAFSRQDCVSHSDLEVREQFTVMHTVLPDLNSVAIFSLQKDLCTVINDAFSNVYFTAAEAPVWRHLHQRSYTDPHQKLYGYYHDHRMEVISYGQNRFKFYNSFAVNNPDDALYYLLSTWKQLGFDAQHDELFLVGDFPDEKAMAEKTQQFLKRIFTIYPSGEFNRAAVTQIPDIPYDIVILYMKGR